MHDPRLLLERTIDPSAAQGLEDGPLDLHHPIRRLVVLGGASPCGELDLTGADRGAISVELPQRPMALFAARIDSSISISISSRLPCCTMDTRTLTVSSGPFNHRRGLRTFSPCFSESYRILINHPSRRGRASSNG